MASWTPASSPQRRSYLAISKKIEDFRTAQQCFKTVASDLVDQDKSDRLIYFTELDEEETGDGGVEKGDKVVEEVVDVITPKKLEKDAGIPVFP